LLIWLNGELHSCTWVRLGQLHLICTGFLFMLFVLWQNVRWTWMQLHGGGDDWKWPCDNSEM
jgi:hypothetical protein